MDRPDLSIVFGTVDRPHEYEACLKSIADDESRKGYEVEIVVCDASLTLASCQSSGEWIAKYKDELPLYRIREREPGGWVRAYNACAAYARGHNLLWLNDDCIVRPGTIGACMEFLKGRPLDLGAIPWREKGEKRYDVKVHMGQAYANFGAISRALFWRLGGFDPIYTTYAADTDLAFEVAKSGGSVLPVEGAAIQHLRSPGRIRQKNEPLRGPDGERFYAKWKRRQFA